MATGFDGFGVIVWWYSGASGFRGYLNDCRVSFGSWSCLPWGVITDIAWEVSFHQRRYRLNGFECWFGWCDFILMKQLLVFLASTSSYTRLSALASVMLACSRSSVFLCWILHSLIWRSCNFWRVAVFASNAAFCGRSCFCASSTLSSRTNYRSPVERVMQSDITHRILGRDISPLSCQQPLSVWFHEPWRDFSLAFWC